MNKRTMAIARATGMIGATAALVVGVTFANFTATASLTDNTLATASAGLEVSNGGDFGPSAQGFQITNLVPGTESTPYLFDLRTTGGVPLAITANVPVVPTYNGFVEGGFNNVHIKFSAVGGGVVKETTLGALLAGQVAFDTIAGTETKNYNVTVKIDPSAVTGGSANINAFAIVFTGTQPSPSS